MNIFENEINKTYLYLDSLITDSKLTEKEKKTIKINTVALILLAACVLIINKTKNSSIEFYLKSRSNKTKRKLLNTKPKMSVLERLEKNRKYAADQQKNETPKGFVIGSEPVPDKIKVMVKNTDIVTKKRFRNVEVDRELFKRREDIKGVKIGTASCQGRRSNMEDADVADYSSFYVNGAEHSFHLFGVFDGHGGCQASAFVKERLLQYLKEAFEKENAEGLTDDGIFQAFKTCCEKLDKDYLGEGGTTATFAVLLNGKIWVANVGDSRTILVTREGVAVQASEDAKLIIPRYRDEIVNDLGGEIGADGRVNGILSLARAIGDKQIIGKTGKCCISPNPKITCYSLEDFKDGFLVLACDGLYDVATTNEVGQAIYKMSQKKESVQKMSGRLVYQAIQRGSADNVSAMVIKL